MVIASFWGFDAKICLQRWCSAGRLRKDGQDGCQCRTSSWGCCRPSCRDQSAWVNQSQSWGFSWPTGISEQYVNFNSVIQRVIHCHLLKHDSNIQVCPGESLPHHPLATIFVKELLHVLDEVVKLALEFLPVFLSGIFGIEEWMNWNRSWGWAYYFSVVCLHLMIQLTILPSVTSEQNSAIRSHWAISMLFLPAMPTSLATNLVMVFDCAITLPSHVTCGTKPNLVAEMKWITWIHHFVWKHESLQFLTWFCCSPFLNLESFVLKLDSTIIEDHPDDLYPPISVKVQNFYLWSHCVGQI